MKRPTTRSLRTLPVVAALITAAASTQFGAAATTASATATIKPTKPGFYLSGVGRVTTAHAWGNSTTDKHGGEHVVVTSRRGTRLHYVTKLPGRRWAEHARQFSPATSPGHKLRIYGWPFITPSTNGNRIDVVAELCDGVYSASTSIASRHLPALVNGHRYSDGSSACSNDDRADYLKGAVALPRNRLAVMNDYIGDDGVSVAIGTPGGALTTAALPNSTGWQGQLLGRDPVSGELTAAATSSSGSCTSLAVWSRLPGRPWTGPVMAPLNNLPLIPRSITAYAGKVRVALEDSVSNSCSGTEIPSPPLPISTMSRSAHGTWQPPVTLPHSPKGPDNALAPIIRYDVHGRLAIAFTGPSARKHGILITDLITETHRHGKWGPRETRKTHSDGLVDSLNFTSSGRPRIGYEVLGQY